MALTLTSVANVLVTMAIGPLFTALLARVALGHRLAARTWGAIALAGVGIAWMYGHEVQASDARAMLGMGVALAVPLAAAVNWTLLQHLKARRHAGESPPDMLSAVLIGALLSAAVTLPLAWPLTASAHDLGLLALLGTVQLAIPCLMAVAVARVLSGPEISLLGLLEVVFGVLWAWLGAGEAGRWAAGAGGAGGQRDVGPARTPGCAPGLSRRPRARSSTHPVKSCSSAERRAALRLHPDRRNRRQCSGPHGAMQVPATKVNGLSAQAGSPFFLARGRGPGLALSPARARPP